jgi:hypothetical protein
MEREADSCAVESTAVGIDARSDVRMGELFPYLISDLKGHA